MNTKLKIAMAQIAPVWLNKKASLDKVLSYISKAGQEGNDLVVFGESLVPGYPFWLSITNGSAFNSGPQKLIHSHYVQNAVCIEEGDLDPVCKLAQQYKIAIYLGIIERPKARGGHSLYCSLIYINKEGTIASVHRKLQPTFEERLSWSPGDGHGLVTHKLGAFTVGGLNCWENWMPLSRTALYAQGENLHIAVWPGAKRNTNDISRFIAVESRSFVVSVSGLFGKDQITDDIPHADLIRANCPVSLADGGSCIAGPDGEWIVEPVVDKEGLFCGEIDLKKVYEERQNFDPVGHYSRPDVTKLILNRERQSLITIKDKNDKDL